MATWDGDRDDEPPFEAGDEHEFESERLDLAEEERLPWLESADDDDDGGDGADTGKLVAFLLGGLVLLGALVGGIWWMTHRGEPQELQADGSVIQAPATPYKEAPKDPGGKTFAGTGDTSFAVSEGQTRAVKLGEGEAAPKPSVDLGAKPATSSSAAAVAKPTAAAPTGVGVQVGAYTSQATAEAGWTRLSQQNGSILSGVQHRIVEGRADIGTVYRLQAVLGDASAANALCDRLKAAGVACQVKH
jgi:hypothetical protein